MLLRIFTLCIVLTNALDCSTCLYRSTIPSPPGPWYKPLSQSEQCQEIDATDVIQTETSISRGTNNWYGIVPSAQSAVSSNICAFVDSDGKKFSCVRDEQGGQCGVIPPDGMCALRLKAPTENSVVSTFNWTNIISDVSQLDVLPSSNCTSGVCHTVYMTSFVQYERTNIITNNLRVASDICSTSFELIEYSISDCTNIGARVVYPAGVTISYVDSRAAITNSRRRLDIPTPSQVRVDKFLGFTVFNTNDVWTRTSFLLDLDVIDVVMLNDVTEVSMDINNNINIELVGNNLIATSLNSSLCCESGYTFYIGVESQPNDVNLTNLTFNTIAFEEVELTLYNETSAQNYTVNQTVQNGYYFEFNTVANTPAQYVSLTNYVYYPPPNTPPSPSSPPPSHIPSPISPPTMSPPRMASPPATPPTKTKSPVVLIIIITILSIILAGGISVYFIIPRIRKMTQNTVSIVFDKF